MANQHLVGTLGRRAGFLKRHGFFAPPRPSRRSWRKEEWIRDDLHPHGILADVTPAPGNTYTPATWPPRGRGRGESITSPRRIEARKRAARVLQLRAEGHTWQVIARVCGYRDKSGAYRAAQRVLERIDHVAARREYQRRYA